MSEVILAALRCIEEVVRLTQPPIHDGTKMVLVPEVLFKRLEQAVKVALDAHEKDHSVESYIKALRDKVKE